MKIICLFLNIAALFVLPQIVVADQVVGFPEAQPKIDLTFPEDWEVKFKDEVLYAHPAEDASYFYSLSELENSTADLPAAVAEVKEGVEDLFTNVTYDEPQTTEGEGIHLMIVNAKGVDEDGKANINICMISRTGEESIYVLKSVSSQKAFEKYGDAGVQVINSIAAHGASAVIAEAPANQKVQTYDYPDKSKPQLSVNFPADWKVESDENGAYVTSADKQFTVSIIAIDTKHIMGATDSIGKDVTARYKSVVWNGGGKPTTKMDEATKVSWTMNEGVAEGKNGEAYKVGLFQVAKLGSDKFFVLSTWMTEKGAETNGEGIFMMLSSIKLQ